MPPHDRSAKLKRLIIGMFVVIMVMAAALLVVTVARPPSQQTSAVEQPAPSPAAEAPPRRVSPAVFLALACVFNLSLVALLGALALRRRMDRISPDR